VKNSNAVEQGGFRRSRGGLGESSGAGVTTAAENEAGAARSADAVCMGFKVTGPVVNRAGSTEFT
jgi:hypothetical protein